MNWSGQPAHDEVPVVSELVRRAEELRAPSARRPYFSRRNSPTSSDELPSLEPDWATAKERFSTLAVQWQATGYFGVHYPDGCVDIDEDLTNNLTDKLAALYGQRPPVLKYSGTEGWSNNDFCDLVELLH